MSKRSDAVVNLMTGAGEDEVVYGGKYRFVAEPALRRKELQNLYQFNWLASMVVKLLPQHALENGFSAIPEGALPSDDPEADPNAPPPAGDPAAPAPKADAFTPPDPKRAGPNANDKDRAPVGLEPPKPKGPPAPGSDKLFHEAAGVDEEVMTRFKELNFSPACPEGYLMRWLNLARLEGGAALLIGTSTDPSQPWEPGASKDEADPAATTKPGAKSPVKKDVDELVDPETDDNDTSEDEVLWLDVVSKHDLEIIDEARDEDANSPTYKQPVLFKITGDHPRAETVFHRDRMLFAPGEPSLGDPVDKTDRFWSDSVLQKVFVSLMRYMEAQQGIAGSLGRFDIITFKSKGLIDSMAELGGEEFRARMRIMDKGVSNHRLLFLDVEAEEEAERLSTTLAGVPEAAAEVAYEISGASGIPFILLFGRSPSGLGNAGGEAEMQAWNDRVKVFQEVILRPQLEKLMTAIGGGTAYSIEFTEAEKAEKPMNPIEQAAALALTPPGEDPPTPPKPAKPE